MLEIHSLDKSQSIRFIDYLETVKKGPKALVELAGHRLANAKFLSFFDKNDPRIKELIDESVTLIDIAHDIESNGDSTRTI